MGCERPRGPFIGLLRDAHIKFPPNWSNTLPPPATREELRVQMAPMFQKRNLSEPQVVEALDFLEQYEGRYYEAMEGERQGSTFHRPCGGGVMVQGETGIFCANCGRLRDLLPPVFMR